MKLHYAAAFCLFLLSAFDTKSQNVGIGTNNPAYKLTVKTPANSWGLMHTDSTVYLGSYIYPGGAAGFGTRSNHPLYLFTNNTDAPPAITLDAGGVKVGVGTFTPAYNLDIHSAGNAQLRLQEGVGAQTALLSRYTNRFEMQSGDAFEFSVGGVDQRNLCIANNGYVGIATSTPTNYLQVGSYINNGYGGNQIAYGFGTNVTVLNQYASFSNFLSSTALNIQSVKDIYIMPGNGNGHVGINTNTPTYPLEIAAAPGVLGTDNSLAASYGVGFNSGGNPSPSTGGTNSEIQVAVYAAGCIEAGTFYAISDERIKKIIGKTDNTKDLQTINAIQVTDYRMKDTKTYGNRVFKKVLAQQVEQVYPQAVNQQKDFIPNTYLSTDNVIKNDGYYVLHFDKKHNLSTHAKLLKVYDKNSERKLEIISVITENDVAVKADKLPAQLFVYGEQVNDFRSVDYEGLTTLNISATQQLSKLVKQQQEEIELLKTAVRELKQQIKK